MSDRKLLHHREDVEIVGSEIFLVEIAVSRVVVVVVVIIVVQLIRSGSTTVIVILVQQTQLGSDLQPGDQMGILKVGPEVTIFGDVGQQLQRHQHVLVARHRRQDPDHGRSIHQDARIAGGG